MRYVSKPSVIEAVQWLGGDPDPLSAIAPHKVRIGDGNALELLAGKDGAQEWVPVPVGHWLVREPGDPSDVWPVDPDYFARKYEQQGFEFVPVTVSATHCQEAIVFGTLSDPSEPVLAEHVELFARRPVRS